VVEEVGRKGVWQERWARVERSKEKGVVKEITRVYVEKEQGGWQEWRERT